MRCWVRSVEAGQAAQQAWRARRQGSLCLALDLSAASNRTSDGAPLTGQHYRRQKGSRGEDQVTVLAGGASWGALGLA